MDSRPTRPTRRGAARSGHKQKRMRERNAAKMAAKAQKAMVLDTRTEAEVEAYMHSDKRRKIEEMSAASFFETGAEPDPTDDAAEHEEDAGTLAVIEAAEKFQTDFINDE